MSGTLHGSKAQVNDMNWSSWSEFVAMGGYAQYVWGSLGVVALVLAAEVAQLLMGSSTLRQSSQAKAKEGR